MGTIFLLSLVTCASMMPVEELPAASWQTALGLGFVSAVFDNIPLTALALKQGGYDWGYLAYAVGFGGSMIWFGSSAGVALSNMYPEAKSVGLWLRHGWHVAVAYVIGFFVMLAVLGWHPDADHRERGAVPRTPQSLSLPPCLRFQPAAPPRTSRTRPSNVDIDIAVQQSCGAANARVRRRPQAGVTHVMQTEHVTPFTPPTAVRDQRASYSGDVNAFMSRRARADRGRSAGQRRDPGVLAEPPQGRRGHGPPAAGVRAPRKTHGRSSWSTPSQHSRRTSISRPRSPAWWPIP